MNGETNVFHLLCVHIYVETDLLSISLHMLMVANLDIMQRKTENDWTPGTWVLIC